MLIKFDHFTDPPHTGSGFISRSDDVPDPVAGSTADDKAWLQALLFPDGSALIDYGDGTLIVDPPPPYDPR
jgi:hypothetical protein